MATKKIRKQQEDLRRKIEKTERVQWKGRYRSQIYKIEQQHHRNIVNKTQAKNIRARHENVIRKSERKQAAQKEYQKRVKKGTDALSKLTKEQRKQAAAKAAQTRIENRLKKQEWDNLTRGQKISRGKQAAKEKKQRRQEAGRKAYETAVRKARERYETHLDKLTEQEYKERRRGNEAHERDRDNEAAAHDTPTEELVNIYLKYGQFASEKTMAKMRQNEQFKKILHMKIKEENKSRFGRREAGEWYSRSGFDVDKLLELAAGKNIKDIELPKEPKFDPYSWTYSSEQEKYDYIKAFKMAHQKNRVKTVADIKRDIKEELRKKINFEYKPGKKYPWD